MAQRDDSMSEIPHLQAFDGADQRCLDLVTSAGHDYLAGKFLLAAPGDKVSTPLAALLDAAHFEAVTADYGLRHPGVDRRAIVSLWSLFYLSTVGIGVIVAASVYGVRLPLALQDLCVLHEKGGPPAAILLPHGGARYDGPVGVEALQALVRDHCDPLIEAIARGQKVSKRMLWNNLVVYLDWVIREIGAHIGDDAVADVLTALHAPQFADGMKNPLHGLLRRDGTSGEPVRKVCCLRYCVPGVGGCGGMCPLPEGRAAAQAIAAE
jgi:ferric iron reductase protein FhuF